MKTLLIIVLSTVSIYSPSLLIACNDGFSGSGEFRETQVLPEWEDIHQYEAILSEKLQSYFKINASIKVEKIFSKRYSLPFNLNGKNALIVIRNYNYASLSNSLSQVVRDTGIFMLVRGDGSFLDVIRGKYLKMNGSTVMVSVNGKQHRINYADILDIQKEL